MYYYMNPDKRLEALQWTVPPEAALIVPTLQLHDKSHPTDSYPCSLTIGPIIANMELSLQHCNL